MPHEHPPEGPVCNLCGRIAEEQKQFDAGYVEALKETDLWLQDLAGSIDDTAPPNEVRAIGFIQGLVAERKARIPLFMQW